VLGGATANPTGRSPLYGQPLSGWTLAGAGSNEDERSFLQAIQARRHRDPDEIGNRDEARLRRRLQLAARIDQDAIHFTEPRDNSNISL